LRALADRNATIELRPRDANGQVVAAGKSRILDFSSETEALYVDIPTHEGTPLPLAAGQSVSVLFDFNHRLYAFESAVIERQIYRSGSGAIPAYILRAPQHIDDGNRRRHFRVEPLFKSMPRVQWRPQLPDAEAQKKIPWFDAKVRDVSARGIGLLIAERISQNLRPGILLQLSITLPAAFAPLALVGQVRRISDRPVVEDLRVVGVEFEVENVDPDAGIDELANYVADCQREIARNLRRD
jgi:c-di-GMP-binding flagellar brake protein YcgR